MALITCREKRQSFKQAGLPMGLKIQRFMHVHGLPDIPTVTVGRWQMEDTVEYLPKYRYLGFR